MNQFYRKIDHTSRERMEEFLKSHFRYNTLNSWNRATTYANNMKIYKLGLTPEQLDKVSDIMSCEGFYDSIYDLIYAFDAENDSKWQAGFNGRSGGYLVLYSGGLKDTGYKSFCTSCGQRNYRSIEESGCTCGRCRKETRINFKQPLMEKYILGKAIDMDEDFKKAKVFISFTQQMNSWRK